MTKGNIFCPSNGLRCISFIRIPINVLYVSSHVYISQRVKINIQTLVTPEYVIFHVVFVLAPLCTVVATKSRRLATFELYMALQIRVMFIWFSALVAGIPWRSLLMMMLRLGRRQWLVTVYLEPCIAWNDRFHMNCASPLKWSYSDSG